MTEVTQVDIAIFVEKLRKEANRQGDHKTQRICEAVAALTRPASTEAADAPRGPHPSHETRISDASSFDEICIHCGATDGIGTWGALADPCKAVPTEPADSARATDTALAEELRALDAEATPGPWWTCYYDAGDKDEYVNCPSIQAPENEDCAVIHWDGFKQKHWTSANGDQRQIDANAALIVALKNNLPRILAALEGKRT